MSTIGEMDTKAARMKIFEKAYDHILEKYIKQKYTMTQIIDTTFKPLKTKKMLCFIKQKR
jgi:hypothetical protein